MALNNDAGAPPGGGPVRERMLMAAKTLFAEKGYDSASTSAIARAAGSSESQLMKYFGGKQGLLVAIFDEGWNRITREIDRGLLHAPTAAAKLGVLSQTVIQALERDVELKKLVLVEGRRMRSAGATIMVSHGFLDFVARMDSVLGELAAGGQLRPDMHPQAVRSALLGMMEGLLRDHFMGQKGAFPASYPLSELGRVLGAVMPCFLQTGKSRGVE